MQESLIRACLCHIHLHTARHHISQHLEETHYITLPCPIGTEQYIDISKIQFQGQRCRNRLEASYLHMGKFVTFRSHIRINCLTKVRKFSYTAKIISQKHMPGVVAWGK